MNYKSIFFVLLLHMLSNLSFAEKLENFSSNEYHAETYRAPREDVPDSSEAIVGPLIACDIGPLLALANQIKSENLNKCCDNLVEEFTSTFSLINEIKNTLTECCADRISFTFVEDIKNTLTACCGLITDDFFSTWTILQTGFDSTFTQLNEFQDTLTACCEQIEINFQGTFTALIGLLTCTFVSPCSGQPITEPTIISVPGTYCLSNDIVGAITINASNVSLNLNDHTITGLGAGNDALIVNAGSDRIIFNGRIINADRAIVCSNNVNTKLSDIVISDCLIEGVTISNGANIEFDTLYVDNVTGPGVHATGSNNHFVLKNVTVVQAESGIIFDTLSRGLIEDCEVRDCASAAVADGFLIQTGTIVQFNNCSVRGLEAITQANGFHFVTGRNYIVQDCTVQGLQTLVGVDGQGFFLEAGIQDIEIDRCNAIDINATALSAGFRFTGSDIFINNSISQHCRAINLNGNGFISSGSQVVYNNCQAYDCQAVGFSTTATSVVYEYCYSAYNDIGFLINNGSGNVLIGNCVAVNNTTDGFNLPLPGVAIYFCFASKNGVNNYVGVGVINSQNANTQVDNTAVGLNGPFAGHNLFIP